MTQNKCFQCHFNSLLGSSNPWSHSTFQTHILETQEVRRIIAAKSPVTWYLQSIHGNTGLLAQGQCDNFVTSKTWFSVFQISCENESRCDGHVLSFLSSLMLYYLYMFTVEGNDTTGCQWMREQSRAEEIRANIQHKHRWSSLFDVAVRPKELHLLFMLQVFLLSSDESVQGKLPKLVYLLGPGHS